MLLHQGHVCTPSRLCMHVLCGTGASACKLSCSQGQLHSTNATPIQPYTAVLAAPQHTLFICVAHVMTHIPFQYLLICMPAHDPPPPKKNTHTHTLKGGIVPLAKYPMPCKAARHVDRTALQATSPNCHMQAQCTCNPGLRAVLDSFGR